MHNINRNIKAMHDGVLYYLFLAANSFYTHKMFLQDITFLSD